MQNIVYLRNTDWMVNRCLIGSLNLLDFDHFTFLGSFTKRGQNRRFLFDTHVAAVSSVMITCDRFKPTVFILRC